VLLNWSNTAVAHVSHEAGDTFPTCLIHAEKPFRGLGCHCSVKAFKHNTAQKKKNLAFKTLPA